MALESINWQCPSCNGALEFSAESQKLVCPYCGSSYQPESIERHYAERAAQQGSPDGPQVSEASDAAASGIDFQTASAAQKTVDAANADAVRAFLDRAPWAEVEDEGVRCYTCSSCSAQLLVDVATAVTECPYCGNKAVLSGKLEGLARPDGVLPFKNTREDAIAALKAHYAKMRFLPDAFTDQSHLEHIQGVYVPFWLYSLSVDFRSSFECSNVRVFATSSEEITETDFYDVSRAGTVRFERLPVDGSSKMPDAHMDAIEPFDYSDMRPFSLDYLPGFVAERYDLSSDACFGRADERVAATVPTLAAETVEGYASVVPTGCQTSSCTPEVFYALLPVWMLHTTWNGGDYLFAMNGQTGKLIGDLPVDRGKVARFFAVRFAVSFVVAAIACFLCLDAMGGLL